MKKLIKMFVFTIAPSLVLATAQIFIMTIAPTITLAAPPFTLTHGNVLGLWKFTNSISNGPNASSITNAIYLKSSYKNDRYDDLIREVQEMRDCYFGESYHFSGYPDNRRSMVWQLNKFFSLQAANSTNLEEFSSRTISLLPMADHTRLFQILGAFKPVYEDLIWESSRKYLSTTRMKMKKLLKEGNSAKIFDKIKGFYKSTWPDSKSFNIVIYPIPTSKGSLSATIIANTMILPVRIYQKDVTGSVGVLFHELCHSLYDGQSREFQKSIDQYFSESSLPDAKLAYALLNEGLATAIGNGWVYEKLAGKIDDGGWYNNFEIDRFAKGIFPRLKEYLEGNLPIDMKFLESAIQKYSEVFPNASTSYSNLFSKIWLGTDSTINTRRALNSLGEVWRLEQTSMSSPLSHKFTLQSYESKAPGATTLMVFSSTAELDWLASRVESLRKPALFLGNQKGSGVFTFFDTHKSPVLLFKVKDIEEFKELILKLRDLKLMTKEQTFISLK